LPRTTIDAQWACSISSVPGEIMEFTNTQFESLLDQVEQLHQAIASEDTNMGTLAQLLRDRLNRPEQLAAWFDLVEP